MLGEVNDFHFLDNENIADTHHTIRGDNFWRRTAKCQAGYIYSFNRPNTSIKSWLLGAEYDGRVVALWSFGAILSSPWQERHLTFKFPMHYTGGQLNAGKKYHNQGHHGYSIGLTESWMCCEFWFRMLYWNFLSSLLFKWLEQQGSIWKYLEHEETFIVPSDLYPWEHQILSFKCIACCLYGRVCYSFFFECQERNINWDIMS